MPPLGHHKVVKAMCAPEVELRCRSSGSRRVAVAVAAAAAAAGGGAGAGDGDGGGRNKNSRPTSLSHVVTLELQGSKVRDTGEGLSECWFMLVS